MFFFVGSLFYRKTVVIVLHSSLRYMPVYLIWRTPYFKKEPTGKLRYNYFPYNFWFFITIFITDYFVYNQVSMLPKMRMMCKNYFVLCIRLIVNQMCHTLDQQYASLSCWTVKKHRALFTHPWVILKGKLVRE